MTEWLVLRISETRSQKPEDRIVSASHSESPLEVYARSLRLPSTWFIWLLTSGFCPLVQVPETNVFS